jgi:hypothetical protein
MNNQSPRTSRSAAKAPHWENIRNYIAILPEANPHLGHGKFVVHARSQSCLLVKIDGWADRSWSARSCLETSVKRIVTDLVRKWLLTLSCVDLAEGIGRGKTTESRNGIRRESG